MQIQLQRKETIATKCFLKAKNGKTLLTTESEVVLKGGIFGKILEPLMLLISKKMGSDALSAFKYLVENGQPYEGKHSSFREFQQFAKLA